MVEGHTPRVGLPGRDGGGRGLAHRRRSKLRPGGGEVLEHRGAQLVDEAEKALLAPTLERGRKARLAARRIVEEIRDPQHSPQTGVAATQHHLYLGLSRHLPDLLGGRRGLAAVGELLVDPVQLAGIQDPETGRLGEVGDQQLGDAGRQPFELRIAGQVVEDEDRKCSSRQDIPLAPLRGDAGSFGGGAGGDRRRRPVTQEDSGQSHRHQCHQDDGGGRQHRPAPPSGRSQGRPGAQVGAALEHLFQPPGLLQARQPVPDLAGALVAPVGILLQAASDDVADLDSQLPAHGVQVARLVPEDGPGGLRQSLGREGVPAKGHLVEHGTESEDVGPGVRRLARQLFGCHVGHGAEQNAFLGQSVVTPGGFLGEAEIEDFDPAFRGNHHVGRLQVPMDHAALVGGGQRLGQIGGEAEEVFGRQALVGDRLAERLAVDQLHGQKTDPVVFFDRVDGDDVGVIERREHLRLAFESRQPSGTAGLGSRQHLDRDPAVEAGIYAGVDLPHAAGADGADDLVGAEPALAKQVLLAVLGSRIVDCPGLSEGTEVPRVGGRKARRGELDPVEWPLDRALGSKARQRRVGGNLEEIVELSLGVEVRQGFLEQRCVVAAGFLEKSPLLCLGPIKGPEQQVDQLLLALRGHRFSPAKPASCPPCADVARRVRSASRGRPWRATGRGSSRPRPR